MLNQASNAGTPRGRCPLTADTGPSTAPHWLLGVLREAAEEVWKIFSVEKLKGSGIFVRDAIARAVLI